MEAILVIALALMFASPAMRFAASFAAFKRDESNLMASASARVRASSSALQRFSSALILRGVVLILITLKSHVRFHELLSVDLRFGLRIPLKRSLRQ